MLAVSLSGATSDVAGLSAYVALYSVAVWRPFGPALLGLGMVSAAEAIPVVLGTSDLAHMRR